MLDGDHAIVARAMKPTGSRLAEAAQAVMDDTLAAAGLAREDITYCITTGYGRHQFADRDTQVTDLTATARGASFLFPRTRTVLDIGGQTMKASRVDDARKVRTFRLNDKCASAPGCSSRRPCVTWFRHAGHRRSAGDRHRGRVHFGRLHRIRRIGGDQPPEQQRSA